jgi:ABC-type branched-subunit amino acid transport system ATPase component/predicted MFS family arabinose efflux permease
MTTGNQSRLRQLLLAAKDFRGVQATPYGLSPALIIGAIYFFQVLDSAAFIQAGPDLVREYGIDLDTILRITQFVGFCAVFGSLFVGWYADRHRRVPVLLAGTALSGVGAMLTSTGSTALTVGAPRVLDSVSQQAADVPTFSLLSDYYPYEVRGRVFALVGLLAQAATVLAAPLAGASIVYLGLRETFVIFGVPLIVLAALGGLKLREPVRGFFERSAMGADLEVAMTEDEPQSFGEAWRTTWSVRTLRRMLIGSGIIEFGAQSFIFLGFLLYENYHLNAFQRGVVAIPSALSALVAGFIGGGLVDVLSKRRPARVLWLFGTFSGISGAGLAVVATAPPLPLLVLGMCVFTFGGALLGPALVTVTSQVVPPAIRTQGLQIFGLAKLPSLLFGLPIYFSIYHRYGYTWAFLTGVPLYILGAIVLGTSGKFFELDRRNTLATTMAAEEYRATRASGRSKLLVCRNVDVRYDGVQVLFGVDFDVEEGEIIALLGTNGAGKSSLLRSISGIQEASGGAIVLDGRDVTHMPPHEIARRGIVLMPGGRGVFPGLSVRENLLLGAWMIGDPQERKELLEEACEIFPVLRERAATPAGLLSGGEQQQLSMAQALLGRPKLLMIDELSLGLAPAVVGELIEKVRAVHARGVTIILVEQSVNVALTVADRAVFLEKGEVKFVGKTADLLQRPDILRAVYVKGTGSGSLGTSTTDRRPHSQEQLPNVLEVRGIEKGFGGAAVLKGVNLELAQGAVVGLIGPNGSGKTTLFDVISGFQAPDAGQIIYQGADITHLAPHERAAKKLVRRFQDARLFPSLTVYEAVLISLDHTLTSRNLLLGAVAAPQTRRAEVQVRKRADVLIDMLELGAFRDKFVKELSTGLRRIVDLACVLGTEPSVLLLDEPSSGISQSEAEGLAPLLRRIRHEVGCSILIIEHDIPLISRVSDELVALVQGQVLVRGTPDVVLNDDRVIRSYLGDSEAAIARSGGLK